MAEAIVLRGLVVGVDTVRVEEPIPANVLQVHVVLHLKDDPPARRKTAAEYVRQLPLGRRTRQDIDLQIREERDSWRS